MGPLSLGAAASLWVHWMRRAKRTVLKSKLLSNSDSSPSSGFFHHLMKLRRPSLPPLKGIRPRRLASTSSWITDVLLWM